MATILRFPATVIQVATQEVQPASFVVDLQFYKTEDPFYGLGFKVKPVSSDENYFDIEACVLWKVVFARKYSAKTHEYLTKHALTAHGKVIRELIELCIHQHCEAGFVVTIDTDNSKTVVMKKTSTGCSSYLERNK